MTKFVTFVKIIPPYTNQTYARGICRKCVKMLHIKIEDIRRCGPYKQDEYVELTTDTGSINQILLKSYYDLFI